MSKIIDISLPINSSMTTYPGTAETKITAVRSASGTSVLSEIFMTSHAGTHIDAPSHAIEGGDTLSALGLDVFYGPCRVLDMTTCREAIHVEDLEEHAIKNGERILFKTTNSERGFKEFYADYIYLAPEAAEFLAAIGVALVGIDYLSVKQRGVKDNTSHTALLSRSIPILEGIDLSSVRAGEYILSAFPLSFTNIDGAPARAVLLSDDQW